jgi:hypothetical protein
MNSSKTATVLNATLTTMSSVTTRKRAHFHTEESTIVSFSPRLSKDESKAELWYSSQDLYRFKKDAAKFVRLGLGDDSGLERYTLGRDKMKRMALKCVLLAQKQNVSHKFVALVSQECTASATELAFSQGLQDYCNVYGATFENNKRTREQLDFLPAQQERRVIQRTSERSTFLVEPIW